MHIIECFNVYIENNVRFYVWGWEFHDLELFHVMALGQWEHVMTMFGKLLV